MKIRAWLPWSITAVAVAWAIVGAPAPEAAVEWGPKTFAQLARRVSPAVVNIDVLQEVQVFPFFSGEGPVKVQKGVGSGFVIDSTGLIATNHHVIRGRNEITVTFSDGRRIRGKVLASDDVTDVALVRIPGQGLSTLALANSDAAQVGDWVLAFGSPLGLRRTVTSGIISATGREFSEAERVNYLQTDAAINPGNSGGPLVNLAGQVVGINAFIAAGAQGIGFAIPSNTVRDVVTQLRTHGRVERPWLGVKVARLTTELANQVGAKAGQGVVIFEVIPGSPSARAGLEPGDVVLSIGGKSIKDPTDLVTQLSRRKVGQKLDMVVQREGKRRGVSVKLTAKPRMPEE